MKYLIVGLEISAPNMPGPDTTSDSSVGRPQRRPTLFYHGALRRCGPRKHKGRTLILLKPSTYMNLSGKAVRYWMEAEKIAPENLLKSLLTISHCRSVRCGCARRGAPEGITA